MTDKTAVGFQEKFEQYDLGEGHPFRGDRFKDAMRYFRNQGLFNSPEVFLLEPEPASKQDLLRVHDEEYVNLIFRLAEQNKAYDMETPVSPQILEAALLICGNAIECGKVIAEGKAARAVSIGGGYHHAGRSYGGGFCLFNDVAVVTEYLRNQHGFRRFLILDHDVHFGNGTSDIYYKDPAVLYVSLHQDPRTLYPGTGFVWQTGEGKGEGYNVNVPLPPRTGDRTYMYALKEVFIPLAEEFKPDIIITNGGSDPHFADTLGSLALTVTGFFELSKTVRETAEKVCGGKLVLMPGSGYNPRVLPSCWYALVAGVVGVEELETEGHNDGVEEPPECLRIVERTIDELKRLLRKNWSCFGGFTISGVY